MVRITIIKFNFHRLILFFQHGNMFYQIRDSSTRSIFELQLIIKKAVYHSKKKQPATVPNFTNNQSRQG